MSAEPPSGRQFQIEHGGHRATIVEAGGAVRRYDVDDVEVLDPFARDEMADGARGLPLIPWPNRLGDGRYEWDGEVHQLAINEPAKRNSIHGLLGWRAWECATHERSRVLLHTRLLPMPGYPFSLHVELDYSLDDDGLTVSTTATNTGSAPCPYGVGHHPYLSAVGGRLDDCVVQFGATSRIVTDDERQLPIGTVSTAGTFFDLGDPHPFGHRQIDHAFTGLDRDGDGRATLRMSRPDGHVVELWMDEHYRYLQLYTGDTLAPERQRRGLAVEPMTCPPDAFRTGEDVIRLEPETSITTRWGVAQIGNGRS